MTEPNAKLRVAIIGGGICGLSLAVCLLIKGKVDVTVYEAASAFAEIGAGIGLGPNALNVYREAGLYDAYATLAADTRNGLEDVFFEYRFGDGKHDSDLVFALKSEVGQTTVHRADLLDLLVRRVPKEKVHFGKHLCDYEQSASGPVKLFFTDGSSAETDVVIGADGIKSTHVMYGGGRKEQQDDGLVMVPQWTGTVAYRGLIPMERVKAAIGDRLATVPQLWLGLNAHIVQFPIQQGKTVNIVAFVSNRTDGRNPKWHKDTWVELGVSQSEMFKDFAGWVEPVQRILQLCEKPSKWAIFELEKLPHFIDGKVALMGDAAHGMTPHQGNGASQGVEDAYILAHVLSHPSTTASNVNAALKAYEATRKERAQQVQQTSYEAGEVMELVSPCGDDREKLVKDLSKRHEWIWKVDIRAELEKATEELERLIYMSDWK